MQKKENCFFKGCLYDSAENKSSTEDLSVRPEWHLASFSILKEACQLNKSLSLKGDLKQKSITAPINRNGRRRKKHQQQKTTTIFQSIAGTVCWRKLTSESHKSMAMASVILMKSEDVNTVGMRNSRVHHVMSQLSHFCSSLIRSKQTQLHAPQGAQIQSKTYLSYTSTDITIIQKACQLHICLQLCSRSPLKKQKHLPSSEQRISSFTKGLLSVSHWNQNACVCRCLRVCACVCVCMLMIVSRDKILCFKNTLII